MVITSRDGEKYFVIPGVRMGNLFLGPQPLRTAFEKNEEALVESIHDTITPPPHSYVAAYLWYRNEFRADAVVHIGRHGTLEWLPGKSVAQSGSDSSEAILGDLPNINYYILDGGGEAIQARRRSAAVLIGHLTPLTAAGGQQEEFTPIEEIFLNLDKVQGVSNTLVSEYREQARQEIRRLQLDRQLSLDLETTPWEEIQERVEHFIESIEAGPIPMGMHTIGWLPGEQVQKESLAQFILSSLRDEEKRRIEAMLPEWLETLMRNESVKVPEKLASGTRDKVLGVLKEAETWLANLRRSPHLELDNLIAVLEGKYLVSGSLGDPLRTPASLPSGRNLHSFDTSMMPTRAAWEVGKKLADEMLAKFREKTGEYPEKVSMVLWYGETSRHHGAMESQALYLMGVEPVWNERGKVDDVRLIPDADLGRPRVDVVLTVSGMYRDGLSDKIVLLSKAARIAAAAGDNALSRHNLQVAETLKKAGVDPEVAEKAARTRAFSSAPGDYGAGISKMVEQSRNAGNDDGIAGLYVRHMNHLYSDELWGQSVEGGLETQLKGNQAVIHSRSTNVYGVLDNDDFFDYAGGLNLASKTVNGAAPQFYVSNMRSRDRETVEEFGEFLAVELNARLWNPKWIKEMQQSGYAGARQIARHVDHLYGFQATSAEHVDGSYWQKTFDVFVKDSHGLALDQFFDKDNPHALQRMQARLLEVDRQGVYSFSNEDRAILINSYIESVNEHGVDCSANTCGNQKVHEYIAANADLVPGLGDQTLRQFARRLGQATQWASRSFTSAPRVFRQGLSDSAKPLARRAVAPSPAQPAKVPAKPNIEGFRMEESVMNLQSPAYESAPVLSFAWLAAMLLFLLLGAAHEAVRRTSD